MQLRLSQAILKPDFQGEFTASILAAAASPDIISFAGGLPNPVSFPIPEMEAATKKVLEQNGVTALQYSSTAGWPALRRWIAKRYETMGVYGVEADDIIVTNGSQQALAMFGMAMIDPGDPVLVEDPTYLVALQSFHMFNPNVIPVTMNADGIDCEKLAAAVKAHPDAKLKDLVQQLLYEDIVNLRLAPGSKLNVNQLAATLGISRTPVVEAVAGLSDIGFVVSHPGVPGSFVLDLSLTDMINLYRVRDAIESEAAYLCAHHIDDRTVIELSDLADAFRDSVLRRDIRGMKETDMPFHRKIVDACGNPYIVQSYDLILPKLIMYQASMLEFVGKKESEENPWMPSVQFNHIAVISAIRLRLPDLARQAMAEHIANSLSFTSRSGDVADPFQTLKK